MARKVKHVTKGELVQLLCDGNSCIKLLDRSNAHIKRPYARKVVLTLGRYGGFRTDRLAARNRCTNDFGFPECIGREFYALGNTFLGNILTHLNSTYEIILDDYKLVVDNWPPEEIPSKWTY